MKTTTQIGMCTAFSVVLFLFFPMKNGHIQHSAIGKNIFKTKPNLILRLFHIQNIITNGNRSLCARNAQSENWRVCGVSAGSLAGALSQHSPPFLMNLSLLIQSFTSHKNTRTFHTNKQRAEHQMLFSLLAKHKQSVLFDSISCDLINALVCLVYTIYVKLRFGLQIFFSRLLFRAPDKRFGREMSISLLSAHESACELHS